MRFEVDENLPLEVAELLRVDGHEADTVADEALVGVADGRIAEVLLSETRALITLDVGFADIRLYPPAEFPGMVVLRPRSQDKERVLAVLRRVILLLRERSPRGRLWIVNENRVRIR